MNVVDSSGWLEYFADGPGADFFAGAIEDTASLLVPVITIYEVYKRLFQQRGRDTALEAAVSMQLGQVLDLDAGTAIEAAEFPAENKVPMADSIIYIHAKTQDAILWTQDADLEGLEGVRYRAKTS